MAEETKSDTNEETIGTEGTGGSSAVEAPAKPKPQPKSSKKPAPTKKPPQPLPPWKVLLHNDDQNDMLHVVESIVALTPLNAHDAVLRMKEAHESGVALLLVTHRERAELYVEQFQTKRLIVTIEPAE